MSISCLQPLDIEIEISNFYVLYILSLQMQMSASDDDATQPPYQHEDSHDPESDVGPSTGNNLHITFSMPFDIKKFFKFNSSCQTLKHLH